MLKKEITSEYIHRLIENKFYEHNVEIATIKKRLGDLIRANPAPHYKVGDNLRDYTKLWKVHKVLGWDDDRMDYVYLLIDNDNNIAERDQEFLIERNS